MSKDLELHEHYATHREGISCGLDPVECLIQTRVWQTLLVVEVMVGGPQGLSPCIFTSVKMLTRGQDARTTK